MRDDVLKILQHALEPARAAHAHRNVVFLIAAGGNGIDGVGSGERFIFAGERGGGDLRDHEAGIEAGLGSEKRRQQAGERIGHLLDAAFGNSAESGDGNRDLIGGHGQRLAVKISAADDVAFCRLSFTKTSGLSVALLSSTCAISRACERESRTAPWTCGVQRRL